MTHKVGVYGYGEVPNQYIKILAKLGLLSCVYSASDHKTQRPLQVVDKALHDSLKRITICDNFQDFLAQDLTGVVLCAYKAKTLDLINKFREKGCSILLPTDFTRFNIPKKLLKDSDSNSIQTMFDYIYNPGISFYLNSPRQDTTIRVHTTEILNPIDRLNLIGVQAIAVAQKVLDNYSTILIQTIELIENTKNCTKFVLSTDTERVTIELINSDKDVFEIAGIKLSDTFDVKSLQCLKVFSGCGLAPLNFTHKVSNIMTKLNEILTKKNVKDTSVVLPVTQTEYPTKSKRRYHLVIEVKDGKDNVQQHMTSFDSMNNRTAKGDLKKILQKTSLNFPNTKVRVANFSELRNISVSEEFLKFF